MKLAQYSIQIKCHREQRKADYNFVYLYQINQLNKFSPFTRSCQHAIFKLFTSVKEVLPKSCPRFK